MNKRALFPVGMAVPTQPTVQVLNSASVANGVTKILTENYGDRATNAECPPDEPVVVGGTFTCMVAVGGQTKHVQVTVKTPDGQFEVAQPQ